MKIESDQWLRGGPIATHLHLSIDNEADVVAMLDSNMTARAAVLMRRRTDI